jgi:hypothetical protein
LLYWTTEEPTYNGWAYFIKDPLALDKSKWPKES